MFEGIGVWTMLGTLSTTFVGITTPLDCYVGLGVGSPSSAIEVDDPVGLLGCQYDINNTRLFVEHISSFLDGREKGVWVSKANLKRQGKSNLRSKLFERVSGEFPDEECGGFVEPSIASGKTFDKIWEEHSQKVE